MMWDKQPKAVKDSILKSLKIWAYTSRIFSRKEKIKRLYDKSER
jgi:hypothetical protein